MNTQRATNKNVPTANFFEADFNTIYVKNLQSQQKHTIRIIFHENKFAHTREHFKETD